MKQQLVNKSNYLLLRVTFIMKSFSFLCNYVLFCYIFHVFFHYLFLSQFFYICLLLLPFIYFCSLHFHLSVLLLVLSSIFVYIVWKSSLSQQHQIRIKLQPMLNITYGLITFLTEGTNSRCCGFYLLTWILWKRNMSNNNL